MKTANQNQDARSGPERRREALARDLLQRFDRYHPGVLSPAARATLHGLARFVVAQTVELYRARGTIPGLRAHLELLTGGKVVVADSGGVGYSLTPGAELPGEDTPRLAVRVNLRAGEEEVLRGIDELVASSKPAHVIHQVEVASS